MPTTDGGSSGRGGDATKVKKNATARKMGGSSAQLQFENIQLADNKNVTSSVRDLNRSFKGSEKVWGPKQAEFLGSEFDDLTGSKKGLWSFGDPKADYNLNRLVKMSSTGDLLTDKRELRTGGRKSGLDSMASLEQDKKEGKGEMDEERAWFENRHLLQLHQMYVPPPTEEAITAMTTEEQAEKLAETPVS